MAFCLCFSPLVLLISEHVLEKTAGLGHLSNRRSPAPAIGACAGRKPRLPHPARPAFTSLASPGCLAQGPCRESQTIGQPFGKLLRELMQPGTVYKTVHKKG